MVLNMAIKSIIFPWTDRIDVRSRRNQTYDLNAPPFMGPVPQPVTNDVDIDDEYEQRDMSPTYNAPPPAHTAPHFTDHFASTTSEHASKSGPQAGEIPQDGHSATL